MKKLLAVLKHEFFEILPPTIFFFVAFNFILLTTSMLIPEYEANIWSVTKATVGALIVGKVVLLSDKLPLVNMFPHKPLFYNVIWKTLLYQVAACLFRYAEEVIGFLGKADGFMGANRMLFDEVNWWHFLAVQLWLLVLFLGYCMVREFARVVGRGPLLDMFFRAPEPAVQDRRPDQIG